MEVKGKRQISGAITCPMIGCWLIFSVHFIYIGIFHGVQQLYLSIWDIIIDVVLLFTIEAIAVLITLSNSRNNYTFLKLSFIISLINVALNLFYIFIVIFTIFIKDKVPFLNPEKWSKESGKEWIGILLILIK